MFLPGGPPTTTAAGERSNRTWLSPHGYSTQLLARSYRPQGVDATVAPTTTARALDDAAVAPPLAVDAVAAMSADESDVVVKMLNPLLVAVNITIELDRQIALAPGDEITCLSLFGDSLSADNSFENPENVRPVPCRPALLNGGLSAAIELPGLSLTAVTLPIL